MSKVLEILSELKNSGIVLSLDDTGTNLKLRGDLSFLTSDNKNRIKVHKQDLIEFFEGNSKKSDFNIPILTQDSTRFSLAPNQKGIWFHEKMEDLGTAYIIPAIYFYELKDFNITTFYNALKYLVQDNDVFRLIFNENEGEPFQELKENIEIKNHCDFVKVSDFDALKEKISEKSKLNFSSIDSPIWDITVFELPESSYCFYLRIHHLIGDGESLNLFIQKLIEAYTQLQNGLSIDQTNLIKYQDYVSWISDKSNFVNSTSFWKKEFLDYEENFHLISDKVLGVDSESRAFTHTYEFSESLITSIRQLSINNRVSLASIYTAAVGIVLSKRGNSSDFVIGIPTASRNHPQLMKVIGNFVNTLPLRLNIDYSVDHRAYIQDIQNRYLAILDHQIYPFEYILKDIDYQRVSTEYPLFNVMISVPNNAKIVTAEKQIELNRNSNLYDLTFTFIEIDDSLQLILEFDTSKFEKTSVENMVKEVETVLLQLISADIKSLSEISLLNEKQKEKILSSSGNTRNDISYLCVNDLLSTQASKTPLSIAVICNEIEISYKVLEENISNLGNYLQHVKGIKKGDRVVVQIDKSIDQLVSMFAIWKVGGIYVPIDPYFPQERKESILKDCKPVVIIDESFFIEKKASIKNNVETSQPIALERDDLAYLIYTSGTTGKPKGVMISHGNLTNKIGEEQSLLLIDETTITFTLTNLSFDVSFLETVLPLCFGGAVALVSKEVLLDTEGTIKAIGDMGVTHLQGTPTYFSHFNSVLSSEYTSQLKALKTICIGGESLNNLLVVQLKENLPWVKINNHYGPTEITIDALVKSNLVTFEKNNIGKAFGNTRAFVVDFNGNLLPENVIGELIVSGPSVFKGYWGNEKLTNEKLKNVSFIPEKVYFTGDLVRLNTEGEFEFVGRKDHQVKVRGYRIELEEVDQTICGIVGVSQSISRVVDNVLVSWVVSKGSEKEIKDSLRLSLPDYMIPSSIEFIESMPTTLNGKIAVSNLPKHTRFSTEYKAPRTETERKLVSIWQEILGVDKVGITDNFFSLGGHSLKVVQVINRTNKELGKSFSYKEFFSNPTIETICKALQINNLVIPKSALKGPDYPVTPSQKRLWLTGQLGGSRAYNIPLVFDIKGVFNPLDYQRSLYALLKRHDALRMCFKLDEENQLKQYLVDFEDIHLNFKMDDDSKELKEIELELKKLMSDEFDFEQSPLMRVGTFKLSEEKHIGYLVIHHLVTDGWSMELIFREMLAHFGSIRQNGKLAEFEPLKVQYTDYADWLVKNLPTLIEKEKTFWHSKFKEKIPQITLPFQRKSRPNKKTYNGGYFYSYLEKDESDKLKKYSSAQNVTLFSSLLAIFKVLLHKYSGETDFTIGSPISGRFNKQVEDQIGLYLNILPIRSKFKKSSTFNEIVRNEAEVLVSYYDNQFYQIDDIVKELGIKTNQGRTPLFDILVVFQNQTTLEVFKNKIPPKDIVLEAWAKLDVNTVQFDITLSFIEHDNGVVFLIEYNEDVYEEQHVRDLIKDYNFLIEQVLRDDTVPINTFFNTIEYTFLTDKEIVFEKHAEIVVDEREQDDANIVIDESIKIALKEIIQELVNKPVVYTDDFFEIGGSSMEVIQIVDKINEKFNSNYTVINFYENATVNLFHNFMQRSLHSEETNEEDQQPLKKEVENIVVNLSSKQENGQNMIFFPPILGEGILFKPLASILENDYNSYAVNIPIMEAGENMLDRLLHLFYEQLKPILSHEKTNYIVGYSIGVNYTFEVAKFFSEKGYNVKVVLIDRGPYNGDYKVSARLIRSVKKDNEPLINHAKLFGIDETIIEDRIEQSLNVFSNYTIEGKINVPIYTFESKNSSTSGYMQKWQEFTQQPQEVKYLEGSHYEALSQDNLGTIARLLISIKS